MNNSSQTQFGFDDLWTRQAEKLSWFKKWSKVLHWNEPFAHWFVDGEINASYVCLDAHIENQAFKNKMAIIWECENGCEEKITYRELYTQVNNFAHILQQKGVKKGDVVIIYLPMIPQAIIAMLAIARIGAIHSVVFSGFSAAALRDRIIDTKAKFLVTCDVAYYRSKLLNIKKSADEAIENLSWIKNLFVFTRITSEQSTQIKSLDVVINNENLISNLNLVEPVHVESNHPLFILYTSGTTGKPKGIIHSTGGYLTYVYSTIKWAFNISMESIYWCTADVGWITGHSYVVYGPLMHGATIYMREGALDIPNPSVWWKAIERHKISIFYTSPTALRMFMKLGNHVFENTDLSSLTVLGSVGEPINPEVWAWFDKYIGHKKCPIIDTWWQTETGGFMIAPTAGLDLVELKPGSATLPLPGISAKVVDHNGASVQAQNKGYLVITEPWPGMAIGIHNNSDLFKQIYWSKFKNAYYSGDYAIKDLDGFFWLLGRADEVLNVSGHRISTTEIENATLEHIAVAETAAVGVNDAVKGEAVVIFITLKNKYAASIQLKQEITQVIRTQIGAFAAPRNVYFVAQLPKTRSGKIMRRILKAIVHGDQIGDLSTLEDGASVEEIKEKWEHLANQCN